MKAIKTLALASLAFTAGPATAAQQLDVTDCEIYVDDISLVTYSAYGASSESLVAHLVPRSDLNAQVLAAGGYFAVNGQY